MELILNMFHYNYVVHVKFGQAGGDINSPNLLVCIAGIYLQLGK